MARKAAYKRNQQSRWSMFLVSFVIVILTIVVCVKCIELNGALGAYKEKEAALQEQILAEQQRSEEIEQEGKRRQTKEFVEEEAKNKLGMVYPDEILFKEE